MNPAITIKRASDIPDIFAGTGSRLGIAHPFKHKTECG